MYSVFTFCLIIHLVPHCSSFVRLPCSCSEMIVLLYCTNLWCSNILPFLVFRNTDYAQIGLLQFFIVCGVCKMEFFHQAHFGSTLRGPLSMCILGSIFLSPVRQSSF